MIIYFNPECSKCKGALDLLEKNNCEVEVRNYLAEPPGKEELRELVDKLGCRPIDIVRQKEPLFAEKFEGKDLSDEEWLDALVKYPALIERPIVIDGARAIIGRPPERVLELVKTGN